MLSKWRKFLIDNGAEFKDSDVEHFGAPERERRLICAGTVIADLSHYSILKVSGQDAEDFLQNQLTNDVVALQNGHSQYSAWCNNKGRVITMLLVLRLDDSFILLLPGELINKVGQKLAMFILRSKVKLEQITDQVIFGISGPEASNEITEVGLQCPKMEYRFTFVDDILLNRIPGLTPRYIIITDVKKAQDIWSKLDVKSAPVGRNSWDLTDIRAGIPFIDKNTSENFVPQMLNLHQLPAIDFKKGCYPGQEVVARMQYLGKLKRKMYHVEIARMTLKANGEQLVSPTSKSSQGAGNIVNSVLNGDTRVEALAVLEQEILNNNDLQDEEGNSVKHMEITY